MTDFDERRLHNSRATISGTTAVLLLDADRLRLKLGTMGLQLAEAAGAPSGLHPVCVDLWHVRDGRIESAEIDQHTWSQTTGAALGAAVGGAFGAASGVSLGGIGGAAMGGRMGERFGPVGWWWGAAAGWLTGTALGGVLGTATGAARAAGAGLRVGREWSETTSRALGTYNEVLVGVPNVLRPGGRGRKYVFVLGMFSDSSVSIWGDRTLRCGYQKRPANIVCDGLATYEVRDKDAAIILSAVSGPAEGQGWREAAEETGLETYRKWFAQPLLGHLGDGRFAVSYLDRILDDRGARVVPAFGRLEIPSDLLGLVSKGEFELGPLSADRPMGAFQTVHLPVRVTYPVHPVDPPHPTR